MKKLLESLQCIDGTWLKMIAVLTMTIDHIGAYLYPSLVWLRIIGRFAFPIFCFSLVEGLLHTRSKKKYGLRLLIFAIISEPIVDLIHGGHLFDISYQGIFVSLLLGYLLICFCEWQWTKKWYLLGIGQIGVFSLLSTVAEYIHSDYGSFGIYLIGLMYLLRRDRILQGVGNVVAQILLYGGIQSYGAFASLGILLYNGKKGRGFKYFFYIYYPLHLLILYSIRRWGMMG